MKIAFPILLSLLSVTSARQAPAVRVIVTPLTKAAYLAAKKARIKTKLSVTFPLKKQRGRIVIPTAKGPKVFRDSKLEEDNPDWEEFSYEGYLPQLESHLVLHRHYEWTREILVTKSGQQLTLQEAPEFSPDSSSFVAIAAGLEYWANDNYIRLYRLENHAWREIWHLEPKTWEPAAIYWLSPTTLLLRKQIWTAQTQGGAYTYAQLALRTGTSPRPRE